MSLHRQKNLAAVPTRQLAAQLAERSRQSNLNKAKQQYVFARAMELYNRRNANLEQRRLVRRALSAIANAGGRWTNSRLPLSRFINMNNYMSELNSIFNSGSNENRNNSPVRQTAARKIQTAYRSYKSATRRPKSPKRSPYQPRSMRKIPNTRIGNNK